MPNATISKLAAYAAIEISGRPFISLTAQGAQALGNRFDIARQESKIGDCRVRSDIEIGQRRRTGATALAVIQETLPDKKSGFPWPSV
ncbi:hypothetical protein [Terriglobus roseus]|uniref:Uncharacterized protein n=1 Tax=Terriglobus roseus TaxID=392734 RepID=A0A1G7H7R3_9BACT|nr:hypothetical protein [Terriglobus roseus]SDE96314.1 hypothetical protein SAMN05444167_0943 [Terriglobus roseus]